MLRRLHATLTALLLCAVSALPGCDIPDDAVTGSLQSPESTGDDSAGEVEDPLPTRLLQCEQPIPCDAMPLDDAAVVPDLYGGDDGDATAYSETERCVLATLAAGEPALVQTVADFDASTAYLDIAIVDGGVAFRQAHGDGDSIGTWANPASDCTLRSADFFQACLEADRDPECLEPENWVEDCQELVELQCPDVTG